MRRRPGTTDAPEEGGEDQNLDNKKGLPGQTSAFAQSKFCVAVVIILLVLLFCGILYLDDGGGSGRGVDLELLRALKESDEDVLSQTRVSIKAFIESGGRTQPSFGITRGRYGTASAHGLRKLQKSCNFNPYNATEPPKALLKPGRLADRDRLGDTSVCFLFYSPLLWTRATGGAKGYTLTRIGAGISDKEYLAEALSQYQDDNGCVLGDSSKGFPTTVLLKDKAMCEDFFQDSARWSSDEHALWFIKDANGSLGRHITLLRRSEISALAEDRTYSCPMEGRVASLEVPDMWTPPLAAQGSRHKFDHRFYVLVPSLDPLIVLIRPGYLRFSAANYSQRREAGEGPEEDRKRHVTNLAVQLFDDPATAPARSRAMDAAASREVIKPVTFLAQLLSESRGGRREGEQAARTLRTNAHNAILQALYAMRARLRPRSADSGWFNWGFFAIDVAYDTALNAYVLDVNTGPAPTGKEHPEWYLKDRSATIREAVDILQETVFSLLVRRRMEGGAKHKPTDSDHEWRALNRTGEWELVFHEGLPASSLALQLLRPGSCYRPT